MASYKQPIELLLNFNTFKTAAEKNTLDLILAIFWVPDYTSYRNEKMVRANSSNTLYFYLDK